MAAVSRTDVPRRLLLPAVAGLLVAAACWRTPMAEPDTPVAQVAAPSGIAVGADQQFDTPGEGTPFAIGVHGDAAGPVPRLIVGGPTGEGQAMRLAFDAPVPTQNSIAFDRTNVGAFDQIVLDFDFRVVPSHEGAAGLGVALLNTGPYGTSGAVAPPATVAEEQNFDRSLAVGFQVSSDTTDVSDNRVSVHFDGKLAQQVDLGTTLDLASGEWTHARILVRPRGFSDVTVSLAGCGRVPITVVDGLVIAGLAPYENRPYIAAQADADSANADIDNVSVQEMDAAQVIPDYTNTCRSVVANDFDGSGSPYATGVHAPQPTTAPQLTAGGPNGAGNMLRLAFGRTPPDDRPVSTASQNSITFDRADPAASDQVVADFDMRIKPQAGRGDGLGFALLNTAMYGISGPVAPSAAAEEPNFAGSLGIGFHVSHSTDPAVVSDNRVSVHFNGAQIGQFDVTPALDLAGGEWVHVQAAMRPGGGFSDVTLTLTQCGQPASTVIDRLPVSGFVPYQSRPQFAARAVSGQADHDIANIRVTYLGLDQDVVSFENVCNRAVETDGSHTVNVSRAGNTARAASVRYSTADATAVAGSDYVATTGVLEFAAGETTKSISLGLIDDNVDQGDRTLLVKLDDADTASVIVGPATTRVKIVDDERARQVGSWSEGIPSQVVPINMTLLPTGEVLYWDRWGPNWDGQPRLLDLGTGAIARAAALTYDLFCSGQALMPDGRLLVAGGHVADMDGEAKASIYDPLLGTWTGLQDMNAGRWYPTVVTLGNGDVLVMGGTFIPAGKQQPEIDRLPQVWDVSNNRWRDLSTALQGWVPEWSDYYPFLYVAPNGKVFDAGPHGPSRYLDTTGTGNWTFVANSHLPYRDYGSSVMYAPGKILMTGGNRRDGNGQPILLPESSAEVIDLNQAAPQWRMVAPMEVGRRQHTLTLLPDGHVLATGGSSASGFDNSTGADYQAEMWDPAIEKWTGMAAETHYRGYHSTALLLPDGRVLVGGGGHPDSTVGAQLNFEIYSPPYLFRGSRPRIDAAPSQVGYGRTFSVQTPDAASIKDVTWIRLGSVTHAFNAGQRINQLAFSRNADGTGLEITPPSDPNLAPPGDYMLFLLNGDGVPSVAQFLRVGPAVSA
jgi:galactose oxidase-like protein/Calx-beta domain-containing protein